MKYLEGGSIEVAEQGGLKAKAAEAVMSNLPISDEGERRATTTRGERAIWIGPIRGTEALLFICWLEAQAALL